MTLPATFTWQRWGDATGTYRWVLFDPETDDWWISGDLGYADSFTLTSLPEGVEYGKEYGWSACLQWRPQPTLATFALTGGALCPGAAFSAVLPLLGLVFAWRRR